MRSTMTLGTVSGIPIRIHLNWFLTAILVTWSLAGGYFPQKHPGWERSHYWVLGTFTALLFFGSVLFHELGHALVALSEGVPVKSITLFVLGGVAHIAREPSTAIAEFRIVAAGPFVSLILAALFHALGSLPIFNPEIQDAWFYLSQINLILALFNLIPGFPLDGGRLLRSAIWKLQGDFERATRWATYAGICIAGLFLAAGVTFVLLDNLLNGLWMAFIGWYLGRAAIQHYQLSLAEMSQERGSIWVGMRRLFGQPSHTHPNAGAAAYGFGPVMVAAEPDEPGGKMDGGSGS